MTHKLSLSFDMENDDFVLDVIGMTESDYQREMGE